MKHPEDQFREALQDAVPGHPLVEVGSNPLVLEIPAAHPEVGPIGVSVDPDGFTVYVGRHTHSHFDYGFESTHERLKAVIAHIQDILDDRIVFWSYGPMGGSYRAAETPTLPIPDDAQRYVFSGPIP
jgi:hypothetical protein